MKTNILRIRLLNPFEFAQMMMSYALLLPRATYNILYTITNYYRT